MTGTVFQQENAMALVFYQFFSPAHLFFFIFVSLSCCYFCICGAGARSELYQIFHEAAQTQTRARRITCYCLPLAC